MESQTIAAIATGLTESGIGIIRISGPESYEIIRKIFRTKSGKEPDLQESHRVHYGFIMNVSRETSDQFLDEVLMLNMKGPRSYTGEDTIEIDCHGGVLMMKRVLVVPWSIAPMYCMRTSFLKPIIEEQEAAWQRKSA